jgi:hypothetical protein
MEAGDLLNLRLRNVMTDALPGLRNRCYAKLVDEIGKGAQLGTALAELGESYEMIYRRARTLRKAFNALRRFDLPDVARQLALPDDVRRNAERKVSKRNLLSSNWLEYWLGWAPSVADIAQAVDVIQREIPYKKFKVAVTTNVSTQWGELKSDQDFQFASSSIRGVLGYFGKVRVTNPNLYLAQQMGLVNPFLTGFQLLPLSFIVNWFVNLEQVLGSCTDFLGLALEDTGEFTSMTGSGSEVWGVRTPSPPGTVVMEYFELKYNGFGATRTSGGIPAPTLTASLPDRLSISRAATSVALLVEAFLSPSRKR